MHVDFPDRNTVKRNSQLLRAFLRVPTYLLLISYLSIGYCIGVLSNGASGSVFITPLQDTLRLCAAAVAIAAWYISGTAINDYADYEIDLINLKGDIDRPLVSGQATRQDVKSIAVLASCSALFISAYLSPYLFVLMGVLLLLNLSYSLPPLQLSRRGGVAQILLPLGYVVLPFYFGFSVQGSAQFRESWLLLAALYFHFIGRILLKDYRDVKGDKANGKMTFLLCHGNRVVVYCSILSVGVGALLMVRVLDAYSHYAQYAVLCLAAFGCAVLLRMAQTNVWKQQKPLLAAFGRAMTGSTAALLIGLASYIWNYARSTEAVLALVCIVLYIWSAQRAMHYNIQQLQRPSHKI